MKAKALKRIYVREKNRRVEVNEVLPVLDGGIYLEEVWICDYDSPYAERMFEIIEEN